MPWVFGVLSSCLALDVVPSLALWPSTLEIFSFLSVTEILPSAAVQPAQLDALLPVVALPCEADAKAFPCLQPVALLNMMVVMVVATEMVTREKAGMRAEKTKVSSTSRTSGCFLYSRDGVVMRRTWDTLPPTSTAQVKSYLNATTCIPTHTATLGKLTHTGPFTCRSMVN